MEVKMIKFTASNRTVQFLKDESFLQEARADIQPGIPLEEDIDEEQDEENGYSSDESIEF
jgi:hypothetical protein